MAVKEKCIHRLVPCAAYDVERIESWLQDMALEGWLPEKDGTLFGLMTFRKDAPRNVRYRLQPREHNAGFADVPDAEVQDICAEFGWEYVDSYGNFYIYRSTRPDAREMNSDLQVQAASLKAGKQGSRLTLILDVVLLSNVYTSASVMPLFSLIHFGLAYYLAIFAALIWTGIDSFLQLRHLRRLQKMLKSNIPLDHNKPWRPGAVWALTRKLMYTLVLVLMFGIMFGSCSRRVDLDHINAADYPGQPPFITAANILPEGEYRSKSFLQNFNAYTESGTFFAPVIIDWKEYGEITLPDGTSYEGPLYVTYYVTRYPWVAEGLMKDLYHHAESDRHFTALEAPEISVDEVLCYRNIYPAVLIRQGNVLIEATIGLSHGSHYLLEEWTLQAVNMLTCEK